MVAVLRALPHASESGSTGPVGGIQASTVPETSQGARNVAMCCQLRDERTSVAAGILHPPSSRKRSINALPGFGPGLPLSTAPDTGPGGAV